jgi:D-alanyl-D-alanine carboxypeptidase
VICGILVKEITGQPLHEVYREYVFDPPGMVSTWLEGHEDSRTPEVAHHYSGDIDWTTISPTIDWAGGGLVSTVADLAPSYADCGRSGSSMRAGSRI